MYNLGLLSNSRRENPLTLTNKEKDKIYAFSGNKEYKKKVKNILKRKRGIEYFYDDLINIIYNENREGSRPLIEDIREYTGISFKAIEAEVLSQEFLSKAPFINFSESSKKYEETDVLFYIDGLLYELNKINNAKSRYLKFLLTKFKYDINIGRKDFTSEDFLMDVEDAYIPIMAVLYKINLKNIIPERYFTDLYYFNRQCEENLENPDPNMNPIKRTNINSHKVIMLMFITLLFIALYFHLFY